MLAAYTGVVLTMQVKQGWTKNLDDPCGVNEPCNATLNLECVGGYCACATNYSSDRYGECRKSYGQPCTFVLDCNVDRFLGCDEDGLCTCQKPSEQIFDHDRLACVSLIGFGCDHETAEFGLVCVQNAFCDMPIVNGSMVHICTCNEGYEPTENKLCQPTTLPRNIQN